MSHELSKRAAAARPLDLARVPPHLLCNSCSKPLFNGFQTPHGCRLCQTCVTDLLPPSERRRCPGNTEACRDENDEIEVSQATCIADMATRREVARLQVLCPNCNAGCTVTIPWGQVDAHLESCRFQTLTCELCNERVMKSDLQYHMANECVQRHIQCDLCSQSVRFCDIESKHRNLQSDACCPAFSGLCPHCGDRGGRLDRRAYVLHLAECEESPADCKYSHLGCGARLRRSDLQEHYRDCSDMHLELVEARLRKIETFGPQTSVAPAAADSSEVADVKRRVDSVFEQFKKLQVNVANWAQSTIEMEQMAERFGGISQLRTLLTRLADCRREFEQMQQQQQQQTQQQMQQMQQMQQQMQQMHQEMHQMQQQQQQTQQQMQQILQQLQQTQHQMQQMQELQIQQFLNEVVPVRNLRE